MAEVLVGPGNADATLASALSRLPGIAAAASLASRERIVLVLQTNADLHPPIDFSLPPGVRRVVIVGGGDFGTTQLILPLGSRPPITLGGGVEVEYRDIRFTLALPRPLSPSPPSPIAIFLQQRGGSCLEFRNCVAGLPSEDPARPVESGQVPAAVGPLTFAKLTGNGDRLIAEGLRVGLGFTEGVRAEALFLALSPLVDLRHCGFADMSVGVRLTNVSHARVESTMFRDCGTGLWLAFRPGAAPGGQHDVTDNQFADCVRGAIVQDQSQRQFELGPRPRDTRSLACLRAEVPSPRTGRRVVNILRNEFRAPDASAYPAELTAEENSWGRIEGESLGLRVEFDPHGASPASPWPPLVRVQANVFHLLDHGLGVVVGQHGQVLVDHNTFVANPIRSVFVQKVATSRTRGLGLVVIRNFFQSVSERPWLNTREAEVPPVAPTSRYRFGGVEFKPGLGPLALRVRAWVAANLFCDFGEDQPRVYRIVGSIAGPGNSGGTPSDPLALEISAWDGAETNGPGGLTTWGNLLADDTDSCCVLRLPRVRWVQGDALTMVEFDYHSTLGTPAAPFAGTPPATGFDSGWLELQSVEMEDPERDYHGEVWNFHPLAAALFGACRERRASQGWPLISWGGPQFQGELFDSFMGGRVYVHRDGDDLDALVESFSSGVTNWTPNLLVQAGTTDGGVVVSIPVWASPDYHAHDSYDLTSWVDRTLDRVNSRWVYRAARVFILNSDGQIVELPTRTATTCYFAQGANEARCSFNGGHWPLSFVEYYLDRLARYVQLLTASDSGNRITGWVVSDEMPTSASVNEFMARARDTIEANDPLRRPVYTGVQSVAGSRPHFGSLSGVTGAAGLHWNSALPAADRYWAPPAWGATRGAPVFLGQEGRHVRGSELPREVDDGAGNTILSFTRFLPDRTCLTLANGAVAMLPLPTDQVPDPCKNDFGVVQAYPLDERGNLRFITHHVQSSWHFARSVALPLLLENRSYAHHQGLVHRDALEIGRLVSDRALSLSRQDGHVFFNPAVVPDSGTWLVNLSPNSAEPYRHDFWAGVHHAGGIWCYALAYFDLRSSAGRTAHLSRVVQEGLALLRGSDPLGAGLREALANGQRWQVMREDDDPPPWIEGWANSGQFTRDVDFGRLAGRTPGSPLLPGETGYLDVCVTCLQLGEVSWLIVTNSRIGAGSQDRYLEFDHLGAVRELLPSSTATLGPGTSADWRLSFAQIDAAVLRLEP